MAILKKVVPRDAKVAVVEIRSVPSLKMAGFDKRATSLLNGSFEEAGIPFNRVARFSLCHTGSFPGKAFQNDLLPALREGQFDVILTVGDKAMQGLCQTTRTMDKYAGSLTWNEGLETWILPSYHPSVIYVGPKKTLNSRYDKFDLLFDHIGRLGDLVSGKMPFPPVGGHEVDWELIGDHHDYYTTNSAHEDQAKALFASWLADLDSGRTITYSIDTESRNTNVFRDKAFLMLQVYDGKKAWAVNSGVLNAPEVHDLTTMFLAHENARFTIHNMKYDLQVFRHEYGFSIRKLAERCICTLALALGTTEKARQVGLKYQSRQKLNAPFYEEALDTYVDWDDVDFGNIPPIVLAEYGCKDVFYGYELLPILVAEVKAEGTMQSIKDTMLPAQAEFAELEYEGMVVNAEYAREKAAEWKPIIEAAIGKVQDYAAEQGFPVDLNVTASQAYKAVCDCVPVRAQFHLTGLRVLSYAKALREKGFDLDKCTTCKNKRYVTKNDNRLNVASSNQMQHLCYDMLKMKELPGGEERTCNKFFWELNGNHPLAKLVAQYKELQYLHNNFLEGIHRHIREDGRIHPDFMLFGTKTGRIAVGNPPVHGIPKHSPYSIEVRREFEPDDDTCLIVDVDYLSLEMFMAHHLTGDAKLLENLTSEWDIHTSLAAVIYNKDPADVTKDERQSVKSVNFGAGYGISGFKLALDPAMELATGGDPDVAQGFLDTFWNLYSTWAEKCDEWRAEAYETQYLMTELGRKRRWTLITGDNKNKVNNQAINFPGQSMSSDLCLRSLIRLNRELAAKGWGRVLLSVHDALVFNIKRANLHEAVALISHIMCDPPFETDTPFAVDIEVGRNYGDKEAYSPEIDYMTWTGAKKKEVAA